MSKVADAFAAVGAYWNPIISFWETALLPLP